MTTSGVGRDFPLPLNFLFLAPSQRRCPYPVRADSPKRPFPAVSAVRGGAVTFLVCYAYYYYYI